MRKFGILGCLLFFFLNLVGQINANDSSVQVIGYWEKGEKQSYVITTEKYKIKNNDTTSRNFLKYNVDIQIIDSTADSYTIDWLYKNYEYRTENPIMKKLSSLMEDMIITIKTNKLGVFQEVENWQEIKNYILKSTKMLSSELKNVPEIDKVIANIESLYNTKEAIEASAIREIQQFHTYHGAKYKLNEEYKATVKVLNIYGGEPFDSNINVWLDEYNSEENNYVIRMSQSVDSKQLLDASVDYITKMAKTMGSPAPDTSRLTSLENTTNTASRIHGSGWVIYSIETKEVKSDGNTTVEETIIELL